jgi:hypothetical protein
MLVQSLIEMGSQMTLHSDTPCSGWPSCSMDTTVGPWYSHGDTGIHDTHVQLEQWVMQTHTREGYGVCVFRYGVGAGDLWVTRATP